MQDACKSRWSGEHYFGGWVAPRIYYLGCAGVVRIGGLARHGSVVAGAVDTSHGKPFVEAFPANVDCGEVLVIGAVVASLPYEFIVIAVLPCSNEHAEPGAVHRQGAALAQVRCVLLGFRETLSPLHPGR